MECFVRRLSFLVGLICLTACGQCGTKVGRVPFRQQQIQETPPAEENHANAAFVPVQSEELPQAAAGVSVEGIPVSATTGLVHAFLPYDVDEDGDRDVLLISVQDRVSHIGFASREADGFAPLQVLGSAHLMEGEKNACETFRGHIRAVSKSFAVASVRCADQNPTEPHFVWIIMLGSPPQVRETLSVSKDTSSNQERIALDFASVDLDNDGHEDITVKLSAQSNLVSLVSASISWLNRPAALTMRPDPLHEVWTRLENEGAVAISNKNWDTSLTAARGARSFCDPLCGTFL